MIKDDLRRYRPLIEEIERLNVQISIVRNSRPQTGSGRGGSGSHSDPTMATVMRVESLREKRDKLLEEHAIIAESIQRAIDALNIDEKRVISTYYLDELPSGVYRMTDALGARRLHYSSRWFKLKKREALQKMEKAVNNYVTEA